MNFNSKKLDFLTQFPIGLVFMGLLFINIGEVAL